MSTTNPLDPYTYPSAPELRAALDAGASPEDHWALSEMAWCQERFGFAILEAGRGGPLDRYAVYTVGLIAHSHCEFVVIGQPPETALLVLAALARRIVHNKHFSMQIVDACVREDGEVPVVSVRVEDEVSAQHAAQGLTADLVVLPTEIEEALFPGGLFRHSVDEGRSVMLQVVLPEARAFSNVGMDQPEQPVRLDEPDLQEVPRPLGEIVRAEGRLTDRVWYFQTLREEMALLERGYVCPDHGQDCELEALRKLWAPGRRRIEATSAESGELGPTTDFELGMLHGKLSALRWVLGRHWDFLDLS